MLELGFECRFFWLEEWSPNTVELGLLVYSSCVVN